MSEIESFTCLQKLVDTLDLNSLFCFSCYKAHQNLQLDSKALSKSLVMFVQAELFKESNIQSEHDNSFITLKMVIRQNNLIRHPLGDLVSFSSASHKYFTYLNSMDQLLVTVL